MAGSIIQYVLSLTRGPVLPPILLSYTLLWNRKGKTGEWKEKGKERLNFEYSAVARL